MRTIYDLLFWRVQYWSIQWDPFNVFFFRESSILIYSMRTIYHLLFQKEFNADLYNENHLSFFSFNTDLYNENHLSSSFSERVQYWFIHWELIIYSFFQREYNTDLYNENHLSSSFSERFQYWSIQWEPFIVFFFRESSILIYTMRTIYRLIFQREFNTDLYNENHLSSSFSERVQYWSIQWEPFIVFFFRENSILIYTMRTINLLVFQREYSTDLYNENHSSPCFSERVQYWSYNENHLSPCFSERVQYWFIHWELIISSFFRESKILIYTMRTFIRESFQYWYRQWEKYILKGSSILIYTLRMRERKILIYTMRTIYLFFFREISILIYTMRTIYHLLFQREFNTNLYNDNHLSSSFSKRVQCWSIQWEPFIVFIFRESSILIYSMRTIYHLLFQKEFNADLYNENNFSSSFSGRIWEPLINTMLIYTMIENH